MCMHMHVYIYIYVYAGRATLSLQGSTTYTSHKHVSRTKTFNRHRKMYLQHAVQHLLNISLTRLHTNKPAGTRGLTPTPAYFDIVSARTIRTTRQKDVFICICECWKRSCHVCINSECLCSNALLLYKQ